MSKLEAIVITEKYSETDTVFVAVLLEHFLVGQGQTAEQALSDLRLVIQQTVCANQEMGVGAFQGIGQTPRKFLDLMSNASRSVVHEGGAVGGFSFEIDGSLAA